MIEIRELVIRATVEDSQESSRNRTGRQEPVGRNDKNKCSSETIDMLLQIINDKKER
jgi:hypothetical protein